MTEAELAAYSYTEAAGKRPDYRLAHHRWCWLPRTDIACSYEPFELPDAIYYRLGVRPRFETEAAALAAADEAYRRAWREGWRQFEEAG